MVLLSACGARLPPPSVFGGARRRCSAERSRLRRREGGKGGQQQPQTGRGKGPGRTLNIVPTSRPFPATELGGRRAPMDGSAVSWRKRGVWRAGRTPNPARALFFSFQAGKLANLQASSCQLAAGFLITLFNVMQHRPRTCTRALVPCLASACKLSVVLIDSTMSPL